MRYNSGLSVYRCGPFRNVCHIIIGRFQARAPNSPVIIVATHYDDVLSNERKFPADYVDSLQQLIRGTGACVRAVVYRCLERFVAVADSDKKGLPRVTESVLVSSKTKYNIQHLCHLIYSTAVELRTPGGKDRLLEQKIPASYMALEEVSILIQSYDCRPTNRL